jgi:putative SOS response-associated peptidase YedK
LVNSSTSRRKAGREDGGPFAFAGLGELWTADEKPLESCSILTTDANELMAPIHDRMPVILDAKDFDRWLDPAAQDPAKLQPLLVPYSGSDMTAYPISTFVNSPRNQGPQCIEPVAAS